MTRLVECRMCRRQVPEAQTFLEADGDRMCVYDRQCTKIALTLLGLKSYAASRLAKRLYEEPS